MHSLPTLFVQWGPSLITGDAFHAKADPDGINYPPFHRTFPSRRSFGGCFTLHAASVWLVGFRSREIAHRNVLYLHVSSSTLVCTTPPMVREGNAGAEREKTTRKRTAGWWLTRKTNSTEFYTRPPWYLQINKPPQARWVATRRHFRVIPEMAEKSDYSRSLVLRRTPESIVV